MAVPLQFVPVCGILEYRNEARWVAALEDAVITQTGEKDIGVEALRPEPLSLKIGGRYRHFKGREYRVLAVASDSETCEPMVVYQQLYGDEGLWVRPVAMFTEYVFREGCWIPRFAPVEETV